jgi:hypothetical protein
MVDGDVSSRLNFIHYRQNEFAHRGEDIDFVLDCAEGNYGNCSGRKVLLELDALVDGDHYAKACPFACGKQAAIAESFPPQSATVDHLVPW